MPTCETCRWWERYDEADQKDEDEDWGDCMGPPFTIFRGGTPLGFGCIEHKPCEPKEPTDG